MDCPDADTLGSLAAGGLSPAERAVVANHAAGCSSCHAVLGELLAAVEATATAATMSPDGATRPPPPSSALIAGSRIDRYVIENRIGAGGMGVVYAARDPELGRRVAVKILRAGAQGERLRREAQSLARLSHPNVVAVHDVGEHDGQTFVAMALVEGLNLRHWLVQPRTVAEVLRHLVAAGHGVAAAHAAGLIHRDLKPDNVFISDTGAALVGDFGLAREADSSDGPLGDGAAAATGNEPLTQTGAVVGTPAYMAPEQATGDATAASDQFSFCVTAWEALYGTRPFAGNTSEAVLTAARAGRITAPKSDRGVPAAVHRALLRGLSADAADRFPSMNALVAAMTPRPRRWPWIAAGGGALAGTALVVALLSGRGAPPGAVCDGTDTLLARVWNPGRRGEVERTLTARAAGDAGSVAGVLTAIDRYATGWNAMRHEACLATEVRREQRPEVMAARTACLDQRAAALRAALTVIDADDGPPPREALRLIEDVRAIDRCASSRVAAARSPAIDAVRARLAALPTTSVRDQSAALAAVRAEADRLADPSLLLDVHLFEARHALGHVDPEAAEVAARAALALAEAARDDLARAEAAALLTHALAELDRAPEANGQLQQAIAALERGGGDWEINLTITAARAALARRAGDQAGELELLRHVLAEQRQRRGEASVGFADAAIELWAAQERAHDVAGAAATFELVRRTLPGSEADPQMRVMLEDAADLAFLEGNFPVAIKGAHRRIALTRELGMSAEDQARAQSSLALTLQVAGEFPAALAAYLDASRMYRELPPARRDASSFQQALEATGTLLIELHRPAEALPPLDEARAVAVAGGDTMALFVQSTDISRGRAFFDSGRPAEALVVLDPLVRTMDRTRTPVSQQASASFTLAQALWETGGERDRERARALAKDAIRLMGEAREQFAEQPVYVMFRRLLAKRVATVEDWQQQHP